MDAFAHDTSHRLLDHWVFAWCSLNQRSRRWQAHLDDALQPHRLAATEFLVLWRTGRAAPPGISQVELARELNVSPAQICGVVETLQRRGWLQTLRHSEDRRRMHCTLAKLGSDTLDGLTAELLPMADRCMREDAPLAAFRKEAA